MHLISKKVTNIDFLSILYSNPLPKFKIGDKVRISEYALIFEEGYEPQYTPQVSKIVAIYPKKKPLTYTINDEEDEINIGKFWQKELIKVI